MESTYWCFFLLHVIYTLSPLVSSRPNVLNLAKANARNPHSVDFSRTIKSRIFGLPRFPRLSDLINMHPVGSTNILRMGRSVSDEQFYNDEVDIDSNAEPPKTDDKNNIVCMNPRDGDVDHLICLSARNVTSPFYAVAEPPSEDESDTTTKPNHTDVYLRSVRAAEQGDYRVRKSKGGNFLRFGKAMTFDRFDRGRDNFMRFGRSGGLKRRASADNFMRFGRAFQDEYDRSLRGNAFMRLGRNSYDNCDTDEECLNRAGRSLTPILRYGRPSNPVIPPERNGGIPFLDSEGETNDVDAEWTESEKRSKLNSALRVAQRSKNFLRLGRSSTKECADGDEHCEEENARFRRSLSDDCEKSRTCHDPSRPEQQTANAELKRDTECEKGNRPPGAKCETDSEATDDVPTRSPLPIEKNS